MKDSRHKLVTRSMHESASIDFDALNLPGLPNILIVDDESSIITLISSILITNGFTAEKAQCLKEAFEALAKKTFDILILDLGLPDGSGFSVLDRIIETTPEALVIVITGFHDLDKAVKSIRHGAFDYITKPFSITLFQNRLYSVVDEWKTRTFTRAYQRYLERLVGERTSELRNTVDKIEHTRDVTVYALGAALDLRDPETEDHCRRVSENSILIGEKLGVKGEKVKKLKWGAYLHDIGKIGIPENILLKQGPLTDEEMVIVKKHSMLGYSMIKNIDFLMEASEIVLYHHEKFDGSGYPYGLNGKDIPLFARIFAVADSLDAMIFPRPYRNSISIQEVYDELKRCEGTHFDPEVVSTFLQIPISALHYTEQKKS